MSGNRFPLPNFFIMDMHATSGCAIVHNKEIRKWEAISGHEPTPVVALTAYALKEEAEKSYRAGCTLHLTKPIKKDTLLKTILKISKSPNKEAA